MSLFLLPYRSMDFYDDGGFFFFVLLIIVVVIAVDVAITTASSPFVLKKRVP